MNGTTACILSYNTGILWQFISSGSLCLMQQIKRVGSQFSGKYSKMKKTSFLWMNTTCNNSPGGWFFSLQKIVHINGWLSNSSLSYWLYGGGTNSITRLFCYTGVMIMLICYCEEIMPEHFSISKIKECTAQKLLKNDEIFNFFFL